MSSGDDNSPGDYRPTGETRITSATGGQKGQKIARLGGADPLALMELAKIYGFGEEKYDRYNYLKGYDWSLSIDALFRHLLAFLSGEDRDPESGLLHTAHVAWHGLTLTAFQLRHVGTDDRPPVQTDSDEAFMRRFKEAQQLANDGFIEAAMLVMGIDPGTLDALHLPSIYDEDWGQDEPEDYDDFEEDPGFAPVTFCGMPLDQWRRMGG